MIGGIVVGVLYFAMFVTTYLGTVGHFSGEYPRLARREHRAFALWLAITGPIGFIVSLTETEGYKHGFRL